MISEPLDLIFFKNFKKNYFRSNNSKIILMNPMIHNGGKLLTLHLQSQTIHSQNTQSISSEQLWEVVLTQYDIEEVQDYCNNLFSQQEIVSLYQRFCQLDRNAKGFISADEFLSVPEFAMSPLSQRVLKMVDGLNFKDLVTFLSAFSAKANAHQKIELIFRVYDSDRNGKASFKDMLEVLQDLSGPFMSDEQREIVLSEVLKEAGFTKDSYLTLDDFIKVFGQSDLKMDVEIPDD